MTKASTTTGGTQTTGTDELGGGTRRAVVGLLAVVAAAGALTGCAAPVARESGAALYGPPSLGEWVEVDGRWAVTAHDDEGAVLLQPADTEPAADEVRLAGAAQWVDDKTGDVIWEREDIGDAVYAGSGQLVVALGDGTAREFAGLDPATGETIWSVPESELGECAGWSAVDAWESPEAAGADDGSGDATEDGVASPDETWSRLVLRAPKAACQEGQRALLVEIDAETGEHTEVLRGAGEVTSGFANDHLTIISWVPEAATISFYDDLGTPSPSVVLDRATLLAGSDDMTPTSTFALEIRQMATDRPWARVIGADDDRRMLVNDFLLDPVAGTATAQPNDDCAPRPETTGGYRFQATVHTYDATTVDVCTVTLAGSDEWQVRTNAGGGTEWTAPRVEGWDWGVASCPGDPTDLQDARPLLIGPVPDAALRAYDLLTGEVVWSLDPGQAPGPLDYTTWSDPDRVIVVTEGADGTQLLRTLSLCTGEVVQEREISGAQVEEDMSTTSGWTVAVPLEQTTLLATFHLRGTKPEVPDSDGT